MIKFTRGGIGNAQTPFLVFFVGVMIVFLMVLFLLNMAEGGELVVRSSGMEMTKRFEGFRGQIYQCSAGVNSIGYGFNLSEEFVARLIPDDVISGTRALSKQEGDRIFPVVYDQAVQDAKRYLGEDVFDRLNVMQQDIIVDMTYNLGLARLSGFRQMKAALVRRDYDQAAREMKNSLWYRQTGNRGKHHVSNFTK